MDKIHFYGKTDKDALSYKINETITFTLYPAIGTEIVDRKDIMYYKWEIFYDGGRYETGYQPTKNNLSPLVLTVVLHTPGFVRIIAEACDGNKNPLPDIVRFEGGAGADVEKIGLATQKPDDFNEFWDDIRKSADAVDISKAETTEISCEEFKDFNVFKFSIPTSSNSSSEGILTYPKTGETFDGVIRFMPYGVNRTPINCTKDKITVTVNAHGLSYDVTDEYIKEINREPDGKLFYYGFDNIENSKPDTCYFKDMMLRNLVALKLLKNHPKFNKKNITAQGGSQGAFQATTVAAQDKDITFLDISIPWMCNVAGYKENWKSFDYGRIRGWAPDYALGLCYYDTAVQATEVKCPVKIMARLGDYICPPSGIMALYNNLKTKKELTFYQNGTHGYQSPVDVISKLED